MPQEPSKISSQPPPQTEQNGLAASAQLDPAALKALSAQASWGDKYKKFIFDKGTYFGLNFVVNTLASVALSYKMQMTWKDEFHNVSKKIGEAVSKLSGLNATRVENSVFMATRGFTLTMGGTGLVPVIKGLEDHRQSLQFRLGHALDVMQEKLGMGNAGSKANLAEYDAIKKAMKTGDQTGLPAEQLDRMKKQHHLEEQQDGKLAFRENKLRWRDVILARAAAWVAAIGTNGSLGLIGLRGGLDKVGPPVTEAITKNILPAYGKMKQPDLFSKELINDGILTISSSVTHKVVQDLLQRKPKVISAVQSGPKGFAETVRPGGTGESMGERIEREKEAGIAAMSL